MRQILKKPNREQSLAIRHNKGPCMVYAGPGSGKTTVIVLRICHLIKQHKVDPNKILVLTFAKYAAEEMKIRFQREKDLSYQEKAAVNFGTFHSIFFQIIRKYDSYGLGDILKERDRHLLIRNVVKTLGIGNYEDDDYIREVLLDLSIYKNNFPQKTISQPQSMSIDEFQKILHYYEGYKEEYKKIDFDDMLTKCYLLLKNNSAILKQIRQSFQYILIDEFQDINNVQFEIIRLIAEPLDNLFVVGDDDQSIYSFRGSKPHFILDFHRIYPKVKRIVLNRNYRSQEKIISTANLLIKNNKLRIEKEVIATISHGRDVVYLNPKDKGDEKNLTVSIINELIGMGYSYKDIAIIYRTNLTTSAIIDSFLDNGIPYVARDHIYNIYEHWVSKDIIAYIKLANNLMDKEATRRIINRPTRYITKKALQLASNNDTDTDLISSLKINGNLAPYQIKNIEKLEKDLEVLRELNTHKILEYIRQDIGYDKYLKNYCIEKGIDDTKLFDILDELGGLTKAHLQPQKFIQHIKEFKDALVINKAINSNIDDNKVELLTMHSAKGLEYKVVVILSAIEGDIPHNKSMDNEKSIEEERRLFYVAITRAQELLYISSPLYKDDKELQTSRFVKEMKNTNSTKKILNIKKEKIKNTLKNFIIKGQ